MQANWRVGQARVWDGDTYVWGGDAWYCLGKPNSEARVVRKEVEGETVAQIYKGDRVVDLAVAAQESLRRDPEAVGDLLLRSTSGISVPLRPRG